MKFFLNIEKKINYFKFKFLKQLVKILINPKHMPINHFGSSSSGWDIIETNNLKSSSIISCGVGEDISFEIEFSNFYNSKIYLVDPTPRSMIHYKKILQNIGSKKKNSYRNNANQKISSYPLKKTKKKNLIMINRAIFTKDNNLLKFYKPKNSKNVSHSLQINDNTKINDFIKVKTITINQIIKKFNINNLSLIKLDIEGLAITIIKNIFENKIFPKQICFELDELNYLDLKKFLKILSLKKLSSEYNYEIIKTNDEMNFILLKRF